MSENGEHTSLMDTISGKIHHKSNSSSPLSDSDDDVPSTVFTIKNSLFVRTERVHDILGGGKTADIVLWRNKQVSGGIFAGVTVIWLLFEFIGYHLITFLCYSLKAALALCLVWSYAARLLYRSPPNFPEVLLPEDVFLEVARCVRHEVNEAFVTFCYIASGNNIFAFVKVIAGLWLVSVAGSWFSLLTFSYIVFVFAYTVPVIYETFQDPIDSYCDKFRDVSTNYWDKLMVEINKVIEKIPRRPKQE